MTYLFRRLMRYTFPGGDVQLCFTMRDCWAIYGGICVGALGPALDAGYAVAYLESERGTTVQFGQMNNMSHALGQ